LRTKNLRGIAGTNGASALAEGVIISSGVNWTDFGSTFGSGGGTSVNVPARVADSTNTFYNTVLYVTTTNTLAGSLPAGSSSSYYYASNATSGGSFFYINELGSQVYPGTGGGSGTVSNAAPLVNAQFVVGGGGGAVSTTLNGVLLTNIPLAGLQTTGTISATTFNVSGNVNANSLVLSNSFDGSLATNLNASSLASGTVADARLSSNIPLLSSANTFSNNNEFSVSVQFDAGISVLTQGSISNLQVGTTAAVSPTNKMEVHAAGGMMNVGTNGVLYGNGSGLTGIVVSNTPALTNNLGFTFSGGGSALAPGAVAFVTIPYTCTIKMASMFGVPSGSAVIEVYTCTTNVFDGFSTHPVSGDKITASAPPTISSSTKYYDATLTGWSTTLTNGSILAVSVTSATTITNLNLSLLVTHAP